MTKDELEELKKLAQKTMPFSEVESDKLDRDEYFKLVKINDKFFMKARVLVPEMVDELFRLEDENDKLSHRLYDETGTTGTKGY